MAQWIRLCGVNEAPKPGEVTEVQVEAQAFCLANIEGELHALDNVCPHRQGPLGQGWIEGRTVLCPWHAWAFSVDSGTAEEPEHAQVKVYPLKSEEEGVYADVS